MPCATGFVGEVLPGVAAQLMRGWGAQAAATSSVDARASPPRARHGTTQQIVGALLRPACRTAIPANILHDEQKTSRRDTGAGFRASMPTYQAAASHEWQGRGPVNLAKSTRNALWACSSAPAST